MKPVNGQIIDDVSKLDSLLDTKGETLNFKQDKDVDNDLVYTAKGSDGKTYSAQLQRKSLIVAVYETPKEDKKKEKKAIEERGAKLVQGEKVTGKLDDAKSSERNNKEPEKESKSSSNNKFFSNKKN